MGIILWTLAILTLMWFFKRFLLPFILEKIMWFKMARLFKKMSKKYDGETREKLENLTDMVKEISRETEL